MQKNKNKKIPPIWIIVLILITSHLSESVIFPALPNVSQFLDITEKKASYILTIFLLGFATGTLFWGRISDIYGRRPCLLIGIAIYIGGSISCAFSNSLEMLLVSRFFQAFGSSTGSVMGQSIARDSFQKQERARVFSIIGMFMSLSPALGPFVGGFINDISSWQNIFIFLVIFGMLVFSAVYYHLPETINYENKHSTQFSSTLFAILRDVRVLGFSIILAVGISVRIAYGSEAGFYLVEVLNMKPTYYGLSFIGVALSSSAGSYLSKKLNEKMTSLNVILIGLLVMITGSVIFSSSAITFNYFDIGRISSIFLVVTSMVIIMFGIGISLPNIISLAIEDYEYATGSASSVFGFLYYLFSSIFIFFAGIAHHKKMLFMPLYFLIITILSVVVLKYMVNKRSRITSKK